MRKWLANVFSINESRVSTLILVLFVCLGFILLSPNLKDIPDGWQKVVITLIVCIAGVNAVPSALNGIGYIINGNNQNYYNPYDTYNMYYSQSQYYPMNNEENLDIEGSDNSASAK